MFIKYCWSTIDGETLISNNSNYRSFLLNRTASLIWYMLLEGYDNDKIIEILSTQFKNISKNTIVEELNLVLDDLAEIAVLK